MTGSSLEFSTAGDALFRQVADCFPQARKKRLALEQPLDRDRYHAIRAAAALYVSSCLGSHRTLSEAELVAGLERVGSDLPNYSCLLYTSPSPRD